MRKYTEFQNKVIKEVFKLAKAFDIEEKLSIKFTHTKRARCYSIYNYDRTRYIQSELRLQKTESLYYRGWESSMCHEVAHAVAMLKYNEHGHGKKFIEILDQVVRMYFNNDVFKYNWDFEYENVRQYAINNDYIPVKKGILC